MIFLEALARPLLVCHALVAALLVGAATHHLLWCRHYLFGRFGRAPAERRFALIAAIAFVSTWGLGNLLYPTYKVRVRAEYFDNPPAIAEALARRAAQTLPVLGAAPATSPRLASLAPVARLFDIKEHWAAIGAMASVALLVLSRRAHPEHDRRVVWLYLGLSCLQCGAAWLGAIVGLLTTSYRAVGGAG